AILANDNRIVRVNRSLSLSAVAPCAMSLALSSILRSFAGFVHHHGPAVFFHLRRATSYINRILKSENAGDLPVPTTPEFKMGTNLKPAKALGLDLPRW